MFTPYVALWSALGTAAAAYVGFLALSQDAHVPPGSAGVSDQRFASHISGEISGVKESIAQVQLDLAKLKTDLAGQDARGKVLSAQLNAIERKLGGDASNASEATAPQPEAPTATSAPSGKPSTKVPAAGTTEVQAPASPSPADPRIVNAEQLISPADLGLETASVAVPPAKASKTAAKTVAATEPIDFGTAVVKPAPKPVGIQISSGASVDSLRLSWSLLSDRHAETLKNMEARYVARGDEASPTFDLIAGPIKSKAEAQRVCKALAAKNVPCKVGDFLGEGL